jgi:hypothetical protein
VPDYDFRALSSIDFEHLARDVLNAQLGLRLQGYSAGRDQGIDLRQVSGDGKVTVVQCKHYLDSSWSTFMRAVRREGSRGQELHADRYIFVTSRDLSALGQDQIVDALRPLDVAHEDVWGRNQLNEGLEHQPTVERAHIKLWLTSAGVLDTLINSGRWQRGEATLDDVRERAKLWVHTPAYDEALNVLQREGVCIVYGPPGTGKTFLAEMVLLAAVAEGWSAVHVSGDIEEAWDALLPGQTNQIFYYNDFLGEGQLQVASKNEPTELARFVARIRRLRAHKRFVMTTREQILVQGANEYDALRDLFGDAQQFSVRLDRYPARVRAEILFNHLYFSGILEEDRELIAVDNRIISIIDHAAYNPRLIEAALRSAPPRSADEKLEAISYALDHPDRLWDTSFRKLERLAQQILLTMASLPARPWPLRMIRELAVTDDRLAWWSALRTLESSWLIVMGQPSDRYLTLANPSCREYLLGVLDNAAVADDQVARIRSLDQIISLSQSAGLFTDAENRVQRPELAQALRARHSWLTELIRTRADTDGVTSGELVKVLKDAAALLGIYGRESDTAWLMQRIESAICLAGEVITIQPPDAFLLAERLKQLETETPGQRDMLAEKIVMSAVDDIQTIRHLDAYESLPQHLRMPAVHQAARRRARVVLSDEADYLLQIADDAEAIRVSAADIEQRAQWYGLEVNIGPLLDRANDLITADSQVSPWPKVEDEHEDADSADEATSIRQIFSRWME